MNIDKKILIYISTIILVAIICLAAIPYQIKTLFTLRKNIEELRKNVAQINDDVAKKPDIVAQIDKIKLNILSIKGSVINYQEISSLQADISTAAKETGLEVLEIGFSPVRRYKKVGDTFFLHAPINISLCGKYHALGSFIAKLENARHPLLVETLNIQAGIKKHDIKLSVLALTTE